MIFWFDRSDWFDSREYVVSVEDVGEALSVVIDTVKAAVVDIHYHNLHTYTLKHTLKHTCMHIIYTYTHGICYYTVNTYPSLIVLYIHVYIYCIH